MKAKFLLLLLMYVTGQYANGQAPAAAPATDTTTQRKLADITDQLADIKKIMKDNGKDQTAKVGELILKKTKKVNVYSDVNFTAVAGETIDIDSIMIFTKDGYIVSIEVFAGDKIYTNGLAPIALTSDRIGSVDGLICKKDKTFKYIYTNEILTYKTIKPHIPDNDNFTLTEKDNNHTFFKGVGLNTVFDLRLYSDALGVFGGKANGLVQTDAYFKQVFHRSNIWNAGIFVFNYVKFNLNASKFDSKVAYTDSAAFTRTSLYQKSWLNADLAFNFLNGWLGKKTLSSYYLDFGAGVSLSNLAKSKDTTTITSTYLLLQPGIDLNVADNIGFSFATKFMWSYSPQTDFNNQGGERLFIKPSVGIFWNPPGNEASRIFGRVTYNVDTRDKKEHFLQLQFGYSLQLTSLAK